MDTCEPAARVACLYRVSTKRQTEENDIPMQKNACHGFIASMSGWALEHLERIPEQGETFTYKNLEVTIQELDEQRITKLLIEVKQEEIADE